MVDLREFTQALDRQRKSLVAALNLKLEGLREGSNLCREELDVQLFRLLGAKDPPRHRFGQGWQVLAFFSFTSRGANRELGDLCSLLTVWWLLKDRSDRWRRQRLLIRVGPHRLRHLV